MAVNPFTLSAISTGIGAIGSFFGKQGEDVTTITKQLSPQQQALLLQLKTELGVDAFDTTDIVQNTRERFGNEASALRQSALQRLQRSGAPQMQQESALADLTTRNLRELGSTIADIQFDEQQAEESRRMDIFKQIQSLLSGTETITQTGQRTPSTGQGFASLFGAGLKGLLNPVFGNNKQPIDPYVLGRAQKTFNTPLSQFERG